jgi:hypothetical protein
MRKFLLIIFLVIPFIQSCSQDRNEKSMQKKSIEVIFKEYQEEWLAIPGVQGFYQGESENGDEIIVIMVDKITDEIRKTLPDSVEGYPVIIEEVGVIKPLDPDQLPEK